MAIFGERKRAYDAAYYAANRDRIRSQQTAYKASTAGLLADERAFQRRRLRGGA